MIQGHPGVTTGAMTPPTIDSPPCSSGGEGSSLSGGGIINYALTRSVEKNIFQRSTLITPPLSLHQLQTISTSIPQPLRAVAQVLGNYLNGSLESLPCANSVASLGGRQLIALSDNIFIHFLSVRTWLSVSVADARFLMM